MKAVYFICNNHDWGHVSWRVWDILAEEGYLDRSAGGSAGFDPSAVPESLSRNKTRRKK